MPADDPVRKLALAALDADAQARDLLDGPVGTSRVSFSTLYRYANEPAFELSPADSLKLATDRAAQADLERLISASAVAYMPYQAAAASGAVQRRESETAVLTLTPSRAEATQVYLRIELRDTESTPPAHMFVRRSGGVWLRMVLPAFSGGQAQLLLNSDSEIAIALADPGTEVYLR